MNTLNKISLFILSMAMIFTACQKENYDVVLPDDPEFQAVMVNTNPYVKNMRTFSQDSIYLDCVKIPLPVDFLQASGSTITINDSADLNAASMLPDSLVDFVYPFDAYDNNGLVQIGNIGELAIAITTCASAPLTCGEQQPHVLLFFNALNILTINRYIYKINYPVTIIVDSNQVVLNQDSDYLPAIGGSPFDLPDVDLVYPITITQFGRNIVLNNDNDVCAFYETLDEPCTNKPAHIQFIFNEGAGTRISCAYFTNYPFDITLNNTTIQIQSRDDYLNQLNASPTAYSNIQLIYPVTATKSSDGQTLSFTTAADICQYLNNCQ